MSSIINTRDIEKILKQRKLTDQHKTLMNFPHFSLLKDIDIATLRIAKAIDNNEEICIVGDYDVDGVSSVSIMVEFFHKINKKISYVIPDRFVDGYGISRSVLKRIPPHTKLIITVDNGIVGFDAADLCKEIGIDLIITDHHTVGDRLPEAVAVINPHREDCQYPFKSICGAQVAFLLCASIKDHYKANVNMVEFLDILALAVVGDVLPLVEINRHIVIKGLKIANTQVRPFFKHLLLELGKTQFSYDDFGFQIAPRINAAGRMENAEIAVKAILSKTDEEAQNMVSTLSSINNIRKNIQNDVYNSSLKKIGQDKDFIIIVGEDMHEGIVGIVASKIAEKTGYPSLILSRNENGILKGSGRSVGSVNIYKIIAKASHLLLKFGGHSGACGLSLNEANYNEFKKILKRESSKLPRELFVDKVKSFGEISSDDINLDTIAVINNFAPFGEGNPSPFFTCKDAKIIKSSVMGKENNHTRLLLNWNGKEVEMPVFNSDASKFIIGDNLKFDYFVNINEWNGKKSAQVMCKKIYESALF